MKEHSIADDTSASVDTSEITIYFAGICTHLVGVKETGVPHRVVLVGNNTKSDISIDGQTIHPHAPKLWSIVGNQQPQFLMDLANVRMSIKDASGPLSYAPTFDAVPRLANFANGLALKPLPGVAVDGTPPAMAYFDTSSGSFSAGYVEHDGIPPDTQPVAAALTISNLPGTPTVLFASFDGTAPPPPVQVPSGSILLITNAAVDPNDQDGDFLLHFLSFFGPPYPTGLTFPTEIAFAGLPDLPRVQSGDVHDITSGCSNSRYP